MARARPIKDRPFASDLTPGQEISWENVWIGLREDYPRQLEPLLKALEEWRTESREANIRLA